MLSRLCWYLWQLLPLTYRTYYGDEDGLIHFSVWRMWFGRCFAIDDVVADPWETDNDKVIELADGMGLYDDLDDEDDCDCVCLNCHRELHN
jgi:hypothetical protein